MKRPNVQYDRKDWGYYGTLSLWNIMYGLKKNYEACVKTKKKNPLSEIILHEDQNIKTEAVWSLRSISVGTWIKK